jgi:8-oxo-dGTP pyrophosphatase MutT (NUDIX family)
VITLNHLEKAVKAASSGGSSDHDLNPAFKGALPERGVLRSAAVLIPVIERANGWKVILTKRASHLKHHAGQVSFPGGKVEVGETVEAAALREAEEEIGLPTHSIRVIGALGVHETVTNFTVTPFVAKVETFELVIDVGEVEEVFEVPLDFLMAPENMRVQGRNWQGHRRQYYTIPYGPYYIWGATARMIKVLADKVARCA